LGVAEAGFVHARCPFWCANRQCESTEVVNEQTVEMLIIVLGKSAVLVCGLEC